MKYNNSDDFKKALEAFVDSHAKTPDEKNDLKTRIAIERFLSRIDLIEAIVQGGTAVSKLLPNSPYTNDVDIILREEKVKEMGLDEMEPQDRANAIRAWLNEKTAERVDDYVKQECVMIAPIMDLNKGFPSTKAFMIDEIGQDVFSKFQVDVALQNGDIPTREIKAHNLLSFAEIPNPTISVMCPEYLVADKITLFLSHQEGQHERPHDLAHAALLIQDYDLDQETLAEGLAEYAVARDVVNKLHNKIPDAPPHWKDKFDESIKQAQSELSLERSMQIIREAVEPVRDKAIELACKKTAP